MSGEYEHAFVGSAEMALGAMRKLQLQLQAMDEKTTKDSKRRQLQLALIVLRSICTIATKPEGNHYNIYCDTVVHVIAKYMEPLAIGAKYWTTYLEYLRFLHHVFADKKLLKESAMICDLMTSYPNYLQSEGDYKVILSTYLQHLHSQHYHTHKRDNGDLAKERITNILDALSVLFKCMLQCNKDLNFIYPELIADFVQHLVPRRALSVFNYLASLPASKAQMYDAFFTLLKDLRTPQPTKEELNAYCQRHLEAFVVFIQLDVQDKLQQQLALKHLRACREISVFANDKSANYVFSLLYYFVKLVYGLPNPAEFKDVYKDLSGKLTTFFERYGDVLMQERWFADVPVVIAIVLTHLQQQQQRQSTPFTLFWQQMTSIECYTAHFHLIMGCIRLAPRITETRLLKFDCCTSARKHTIISLVASALDAYSSYAAVVDDSSSENDELFINFRTQLLLVMRHGVSVFDSLACITPESTELKQIHARIVQLTVDMRTTTQIRLCIKIAEFLLRIRHKFSIHDWTLLLRRLYKMALRASDANLTIDLHVAHIASMLQENAWPDMTVLRTRIGCFYTSSPHVRPGQSVLQLALQTNSPFKVFLDANQKYLLHWLEVQQFLKYHKNDEQIQYTLMECSPTQYSEVLVGRGAGVVQSVSVSTRLRKLKKDLAQKMENTAGLTRLEMLCWAHINTALLHEALKLQKDDALAIETKCQEDNLEDLLQRKELAAMTVANELKLIKQATEALHGFRVFFEKIDTEPIVSSEVFIDWEAIVEDLTSLSLYLQLAGYTDLSTEAWLLHYRIANLINDDMNAIRSLTYFCEYSEYFATPNAHGMELDAEIANKQTFLLDSLQQLPTLAKRFQNYTLLYLCQLAYYHARHGHLSYAQILLETVQRLHAELPNQQGKYNVVLGTVDVVRFRILWKHADNGRCHQRNTALERRCLLRDMEETLERFRGDFFKLSSSELMTYTILLLSLVEQIAECAANRLCDHFVNSYFAGTFKLLLQSGSALRLIQMLSMWTWINLQMEFVQKAQTKVKMIEYILGVKNLETLREITTEVAVAKKLPVPPSFAPSDMLHVDMEPLRKMIPSYASPILAGKVQFSPSVRGENSLQRFLRQPCGGDVLQQHEILQWCYFMAGCLKARLHFLVDHHDNLEDFYDSSQQWLQSHRQNTLLSINFQNIQLLSLQHYINYLRKQKKYEKAGSCLEAALLSCTNMQGNVDSVYRINLLLQQSILKREMCAHKENANRVKPRRALAFNQSPDLEALDTGGGAVKSPTPTASAAMASARKKQLSTAAFKIYGGAAVTPGNTPKRAAAMQITKRTTERRLLCNSTQQQQQDLKSLSSARKISKWNLMGETEAKTPAKAISTANARNGGKSLTARKMRQIRAATGTATNTDSSGNSSNSTPDTNILNQCQLIESIDLLDSDNESKGKRNEMPNQINAKAIKCSTSARKAHKNKQREDLLDICKQIETIELMGNDAENCGANKTLSTQQQNEIIEISDSNTDDVLVVSSEPTFVKQSSPAKNAKAKDTTNKRAPPRTSQAEQKNKNRKEKAPTSGSAADASAMEATAMPVNDEPKTIQVVEKVKITEDTKATTTKLKTRTKTEIRTLKVITKETEINMITPNRQQKATSVKENAGSTSTARGRPRTATRNKNVERDNANEAENIAPPVAVGRTLSSRRTRK